MIFEARFSTFNQKKTIVEFLLNYLLNIKLFHIFGLIFLRI